MLLALARQALLQVPFAVSWQVWVWPLRPQSKSILHQWHRNQLTILGSKFFNPWHVFIYDWKPKNKLYVCIHPSIHPLQSNPIQSMPFCTHPIQSNPANAILYRTIYNWYIMISYMYLHVVNAIALCPVSGSKGPAPQIVAVGAATQEPAHAGNIGCVTYKA